MSGRDEWFEIHASDQVKPESGVVKGTTSGFFVDPDAAPAMRKGFEEAIQEMRKARTVMQDMRLLGGGSVNPVVDKVVAALAGVGYGEESSVTAAADSAMVEYQSVIEQLDRAMGAYQGTEDTNVRSLGSQS